MREGGREGGGRGGGREKEGSTSIDKCVNRCDLSPSLPPVADNFNVRSQFYRPQWEHCAFPAPIPEGSRDNGSLDTLTCGLNLNKTLPDSALRVRFNGNMRVTDCSHCCMRWFITINGEECVDPAPIDAVIYSINGSTVNIHRSSTVTGICLGTGSGAIPMGSSMVTMNIGVCDGFNETFNSYTGLESLSTVEVEEMPLRESVCLSVRLSVCVCLSVCLSACLPACLPAFLCLCWRELERGEET